MNTVSESFRLRSLGTTAFVLVALSGCVTSNANTSLPSSEAGDEHSMV